MRIVQATPLQGFRLHLSFEDGVSGEVDLSGFAGRGVFATWLQEETFDRVRVTEAGAVEWPGEVAGKNRPSHLHLTSLKSFIPA